MTKEFVTSAEIGVTIRKRRKELGYSQEQLAEKVGVSYQQIQRYENGSSMLNVENIQRIAKALVLPVEDFFVVGGKQHEREAAGGSLSAEERALLKTFRDMTTTTDRRLAVSVVRRLAKRM